MLRRINCNMNQYIFFLSSFSFTILFIVKFYQS